VHRDSIPCGAFRLDYFGYGFCSLKGPPFDLLHPMKGGSPI